MLPGWRTTALLLLLLLEATQSGAQSGDGDPDAELRLSCSSHISLRGSSLTCRLLGRSGDDEDEGESIQSMDACQRGGDKREKCFHADRDTVSSAELYPVVQVNVTVRLKAGGRLSSTVLLQKIVKPMSPQVWNVTSEPELHRTRVFFQIPYSKDFLTLENQIFQLDLWTKGSYVTTQNVSKQDFLQIDMQHLRKNSEYRVRVRAIPQGAFQGTWSEWSPVVTFSMGPEKPEWQMTVCVVVLSLLLLVVLFSAVVFWKNKIFTYMWPSIPHPKQTLVQICKPDKGLLLNLNPEVFSFLKVHPLESSHSEEAEPSPGSAAADCCRSGSTQSSDCRSTTSVSTEELEISVLLGRNSSDGEDSSAPVTVQNPQAQHAGRGDGFGPNQPEEAYVTMSSFYQIT